jgi:aspartyl/glutamyl-tRNA(Asn/Gln) amidotransferase C subunit
MKESREESSLITDDEISITAELAGLELSQEDFKTVKKALEKILEHFNIIENTGICEVTGGTPVEKPGTIDKARSDGELAVSTESFRQNAPDFEDGFFFIPRIVA